MTPAEFRQARLDLGLTHAEFARMLGCCRQHIARLQSQPQGSRNGVTDTMERLIRAYLGGYRPPDWPVMTEPNRGSRRVREFVRRAYKATGGPTNDLKRVCETFLENERRRTKERSQPDDLQGQV